MTLPAATLTETLSLKGGSKMFFSRILVTFASVTLSVKMVVGCGVSRYDRLIAKPCEWSPQV